MAKRARKALKIEKQMLNEISQTEKDKYCMISLGCGIKTKIKLNSEQFGGCQRQGVGNE